MALITTGIGISEIRGSEGGSTFSRNHYGMYVRQRSVPVNPNSGRQQAARANFAAIAARWLGILTDAQRTAWNLYGSSVPMQNKLGQEIYLTGFSHYLRSNTPRVLAGATIVDAGPVIFSLPEVDPTFAVTISEATQVLSVVFDNTLAWANEDDAIMTISCMKPVAASRAYLVGASRYADVVEGDAITPPTSPATPTAPFVCSEDQRVIVQGRIGRADGRLSNFFSDTVQVAA